MTSSGPSIRPTEALFPSDLPLADQTGGASLAAKEHNRFVKLYAQGALVQTEIWVDTVTGVQYLFHRDGNASGLTPLLGPDGKPVIAPQ